MNKIISAILFLFTLNVIAQKTNVVFILVDDLKPLINSYGESEMITPNFDRFAHEGVVFTNAHAQQAVCAASRVSFMTGMRPDYTQVLDLKTYMRDKVPNSLTIAEHFKSNGYTAVGLGKVLHGTKNDDPQSWSIPFLTNDELPFSDKVRIPADYQYQNEHTHKIYDELIENNTPKRKIKKMLFQAMARPSTETVDVPDNAYSDGAIALKSITLMNDLKKSEEPFFITIGFYKPHLPFTPPKKYWDLYKREEIELAKYQEQAEDSPAYAYHTFGELKNYSDIKENLDENGRVIPSKQKELIHGYYASVSYIDAQLGKILDFLETSDLKENTTVVLIGDHGWHLGDHGLWNKHTNYEQATRTPFFVMSPRIQKSVKNSSPVELIDAFPTICELSNVPSPNHLHGKSLVPILMGDKKKVKNVALSQYPRNGRMGYAIRSENYRYIEWRKGNYKKSKDYMNGEVDAIELYDYKKDPFETKNVANDPTYSKVIEALKKELNTILEEK